MSDPSKVALITGGARRIGKAIVHHLHAHGYRVAVHAHQSGHELHAFLTELERTRPSSTLALLGDLHENAVPETLIARCAGHFGRLDVLINNASNFYPTPLGEVTPAQWDDLFAINAKAPFFLAQAATPLLRKHRGAIINLTDLHGTQPLRQHAVYTAAKAALEMLTRSLALELAPQVRVNAIAPGAILWPTQGIAEAAKQALLARTPLARTGTVEEIAEAVLWLLESANFITGHTLRLDGGRTLT
ncbi:pteridine reductase [Xylella fastidiosa subsp. morus]|uniref:Pteridine reductase n=2 Tax=Xylella fastidiosa TaxID=2371 RepID=A0A9Q4QTH2_XYLFS|nr:pteridine reductase [Xylella fastidiosa]ERI60983.1 pteridine reductase [Xylella fastidiosa subsp. multiplex Griffin-1]ACA11789.1 pteridine reductase [Xylella fastidiosa M12]AIC12243.1 pteridine reductase [Xylella fastidiosa MUL0034]EWG13846.1 pteridine reductase [Xylella fastidiosa Mul-MD]KAJ4852941.1 pteridine reductase [Xylella fastidiosa subsp. multiplex]